MTENETVYDRWLKNDPDETNSMPRINSNMGANSDHAMFLQRAGVPCIDQKFVANNVNKSLLKNVDYSQIILFIGEFYMNKYLVKTTTINLKK